MRANALRNAAVECDAPLGLPLAVYAQYGFQCPFISPIGRMYNGLPQIELALLSAIRYASPAPFALCSGVTASPAPPEVPKPCIGVAPSEAHNEGKFEPQVCPWPQPTITWWTADPSPTAC